ncbi:MAG: phosphoribosyltransferase [Candidatus Bathyarchaeia archaeon]
MVAYEAPSWDEIYEMCIDLASMIKASGFKPDLIVGIARGGWVPARLLSDFLDNPNITSIKVEFYLDIGKTRDEPSITQDIQVSVAGRKVLLVDDVADTGKSLMLVKNHLKDMGASETRIACLYFKPWSIVKPDYYVRETEAWIIFPHEIRESATKIWLKVKAEGGSLRDVKRILVEAGVKRKIVNRIVKEFLHDSGT